MKSSFTSIYFFQDPLKFVALFIGSVQQQNTDSQNQSVLRETSQKTDFRFRENYVGFRFFNSEVEIEQCK